MEFVAYRMALRQFFLRLLLFSPVTTIPPTLHAHLHLHVSLNKRTDGRVLRIFLKALPFRKSDAIVYRLTSILSLKSGSILIYKAQNNDVSIAAQSFVF